MTATYAGVTAGMPDDLSGTGEDESPASDRPDGPRYGDKVQTPTLLTLPPKQAAAQLLKRWTTQDQGYSYWLAEWEVNERRRNGECNIWVVKDQDTNSGRVYLPPGASKVPPAVFNKADRLTGRITSQIYADPAVMEAIPGERDSDESRDAADLATRVLRDLDSEAVLNDFNAHRTAMDHAGSFGSGYLVYEADPYAGGRQPMQMEASPHATSVKDAEYRIVPSYTKQDANGQLQIMPAQKIEWPELVTRYVRPDGTLTDHRAEAALRWVPQLTNTVYPACHVRFWPPEAASFDQAELVLVADYVSWGALQNRYVSLAPTQQVRDNIDDDAAPPSAPIKDVPPPTDEEIEKFLSERIPKTELLLPRVNNRPRDTQTGEKGQRLVFRLRAWAKECPAYPDGLEMCVLGKDYLVSRGPWIGDTKDGREVLDLPVVQVQQFRGERGNPHGRGIMHALGPASEWRAELVGSIEDLLQRINRAKVFWPTNSIYSGKEQLLELMRYVPMNPGGEPSYERVPTDALGPATELFSVATREMDDASHLQQAGQGLETSDAASGRAKYAVLGQVQAGLSDARQNAATAFERAGRIKLQLVRKSYSVPQLLKYTGEDGDFKVRRWLGSDLHGVRDVRLVPGSLSMMAPLQKAQTAMSFAALPGIMPQDELRDLVFQHVSAELGWKDNPHFLRVKQQIAKWEQGPEGERLQQMRTMDDGSVDPTAQAIFTPRPVDNQPDVATIRLRMIGRAMAGWRYTQLPPQWTRALDMAYQQAAMVLTPPAPDPTQVAVQQGIAGQQSQQQAPGALSATGETTTAGPEPGVPPNA